MTFPRRALALAGATLAVVGGTVVARTLSSSEAGAACSAIGYQNGVAAAELRMRRLDPGGFNATRTGAWDKYFSTQRRLVADHDAECTGAPPPTTTTTAPPPTTTAPAPRPAPQAYNRGSSGQDARYCVNGGAGGTDAAGYRYDSGGREIDGRRTGNPVAELKPADEMDGREPCDQYVGPTGRTIGGAAGYPPGSYER
jgi:hypothetical protein